MNRKIKWLYERLCHLQALIDARVHSVAWRSFRPQPWENPVGGGYHSDPTYTAVELLENDPVYQKLKAEYKETRQELEEAIREAAVCGACGLPVVESEDGKCVRCGREVS